MRRNCVCETHHFGLNQKVIPKLLGQTLVGMTTCPVFSGPILPAGSHGSDCYLNLIEVKLHCQVCHCTRPCYAPKTRLMLLYDMDAATQSGRILQSDMENHIDEGGYPTTRVFPRCFVRGDSTNGLHSLAFASRRFDVVTACHSGTCLPFKRLIAADQDLASADTEKRRHEHALPPLPPSFVTPSAPSSAIPVTNSEKPKQGSGARSTSSLGTAMGIVKDSVMQACGMGKSQFLGELTVIASDYGAYQLRDGCYYFACACGEATQVIARDKAKRHFKSRSHNDKYGLLGICCYC